MCNIITVSYRESINNINLYVIFNLGRLERDRFSNFVMKRRKGSKYMQKPDKHRKVATKRGFGQLRPNDMCS